MFSRKKNVLKRKISLKENPPKENVLERKSMFLKEILLMYENVQLNVSTCTIALLTSTFIWLLQLQAVLGQPFPWEILFSIPTYGSTSSHQSLTFSRWEKMVKVLWCSYHRVANKNFSVFNRRIFFFKNHNNKNVFERKSVRKKISSKENLFKRKSLQKKIS